MGIRITDDSTVCLYDSVTGLPLAIEVFEDGYEAEAFLDWVTNEDGRDLRDPRVGSELSAAWNEYLRDDWMQMYYEPVAPELH